MLIEINADMKFVKFNSEWKNAIDCLHFDEVSAI